MRASLGLLVLSSALLGTMPASARLGETPDQCDERYGTKYTEAAGQGYWSAERKYEKNGVRITIRFLRNETGARTAEYIEYKPVNTATNRLTPAKIEGLLALVAPSWTALTPIAPPSQPVKPIQDSSKQLSAPHTKKVIRIGETSGRDKRQAEKDAQDRKEFLESIAAKNREIKKQKDKILKVTTVSAETAWQCPQAYAAGGPSALVIFSAAYMHAYDHQDKIEKVQKAKSDATPFEGL